MKPHEIHVKKGKQEWKTKQSGLHHEISPQYTNTTDVHNIAQKPKNL
jgi:hypothetical protein